MHKKASINETIVLDIEKKTIVSLRDFKMTLLKMEFN